VHTGPEKRRESFTGPDHKKGSAIMKTRVKKIKNLDILGPNFAGLWGSKILVP
jgi:hypothetical protein